MHPNDIRRAEQQAARANDYLPLTGTFVQFSNCDVDVTIWGRTYKAKIGLIGDGHETPVEAGILVLRMTNEGAVVIPCPLCPCPS